jgi:5-hydroxyisourate hydrolase-like protein (transthyretin family)
VLINRRYGWMVVPLTGARLNLARFCALALVIASQFYAAQSARAQLNSNCTVSVLNRTVQVNSDGTWVLPNIPANFGPVRARATCIVNGVTKFGQSALFTISANGSTNVPPIILGNVTPIANSLNIIGLASLGQPGVTSQLTVMATYADGSTQNVTTAASGTIYNVSNPAIATISADGLVTAVSSGTVVIQAVNEGTQGIVNVQVILTGSSHGGIPDDWAIAHGLDPNDPAMPFEDPDHDGLTNLQEFQNGTDPHNPDTDGDGLTDGQEVLMYHTNPLLFSTDGTGISDGIEVADGTLGASFPVKLAAALSSIEVKPSTFVVDVNTLFGQGSQQLKVIGHLIDGKTTLDLTSTLEGTSYSSSDLTICNFGAPDGNIFAGANGSCRITITNSGFTAVASGVIETFSPGPLSWISIPGFANRVRVNGNYAYIAAGSAGLQIVDVSNHSAPHIAAALSLAGNANELRVIGNRIYMAAGSAGLEIIDITNPLSPALLGSIATRGLAWDVAVSGNRAFVAEGNSGLQIIDISTPSAPAIIGSIGIPGIAEGVDVQGNIAVVAASSGGVQIVDVSNPSSPAVVGSVAVPQNDARKVTVNGNIAYVAAFLDSLQIVDFTNPRSPAIVGSTANHVDANGNNLGGYLQDVAFNTATGRTLSFGADVKFVNGVPITDVSAPGNPISLAILDFSKCSGCRDDNGVGIAVDSGYVYLTTERGLGDENGTTEDTRLYIGQYMQLQDTAGIAPTVSIASPASGTNVIEGQSETVTVAATDDIAVAAVSLLVNGQVSSTLTSAPYKFTIEVPQNPAPLTVSAEAIDFGNNVGVAPQIQLNVIPDPGTTVVGRVIDINQNRVSGATVTTTVGAKSAITQSDGSFSILGVPSVSGNIAVVVTATVNGAALTGASTNVAPVQGGTTNVGTIVVTQTPTFADNFNRPDGVVGNGWTNWGNTATLLNGELETFGEIGVGGGIVRTLPVTFPVSFSFDFRTLNVTNQFGSTPFNDGGWGIAFNADSASLGANSQVSFYHYAGSRNIYRKTDSDSDSSPNLPEPIAGWEDYNSNYAHITGLINADLSATFTIVYSDGKTVTTSFGPVSGAPHGSLLLLGNSNASSGPDFFDNFQLVSSPTVSKSAIAGRVFDVATGNPINSASVGIYDATGRFLTSISPNASGQYQFNGLVPNTYYLRTFNGQGYINQVYLGLPADCCSTTIGVPVTVAPGATASGIDFPLALGGRIGGRITDATTGTGLVGASIAVSDTTGRYVMGGSTDGQGNYTTYGGLPAGSYFVQTYNVNGYFNQLYSNKVCLGCSVTSGTPVAVTVGAMTAVNFALTPGGGIISGHVADASSGLPLNNINVNVFDSTGAYVGQGNTDTSGNYILAAGLPTGSYFVRTYNTQGYADQSYSGFTCVTCDVRTGTPISVNAGSTTAINFALSRGGQVSGRVTDAASGNGLANVTVTIYNGTGQGVATASTDANGNYFTPEGMVTGTYYAVTSNSLGYFNQLYNGIQCINCAVTTGTPIQVTTGAATTGINFALSNGGRISGRITDPNTGAGLTSANVNVYDAAGNFVTAGGTDGAGNYVIAGALVPGTYYVRTFNGLGYIDQIYNSLTCLSCSNTGGTPVQVIAGNTTINFALVLGGRIGGRITDVTTGSGVTSASVGVYDVTGRFVMSGATDGQGNYTTYGGLPAGNYFVETSNQKGYFNQLYNGKQCLGCSVTSGTPVAVTVGAITTANFALTPGGGIVAGNITDTNTGLPLANVFVNLFDSTGLYIAGAGSDASGNYIVAAGLPAGTYYARTFNSQGYADQLYSGSSCVSCDVRTGTPVSLTAGSTTTINFVLSRGGQVSGRVTDAATGNGLANVTVTIYNGTGQGVATANTDANGNYFTAEGMVTGTYYAVTSNSLGYFNQLYNGIQCINCAVTAGTPIQVANGVVSTGINFALSTGGRISGRITDASTGTGITNADVNVYDLAGSFVGAGGTDGAGNYVIAGALVPGTYYVRTFNSEGYIDQIYNGIMCLGCGNTSGSPIQVLAGNTTINFALVLGGRIGGRITDASTGNGIANAFVNVYDSTGKYVMGGSTDGQGNYVTGGGVPAGNYFIQTFNQKGYFNQLYQNEQCVGCQVTSGTPVPVTVGNMTAINFALTPGGGIISGRVTDASSGLPLTNVSVSVSDSPGAYVGQGNTDNSGNYILAAGLPTGTYYVRTYNTQGYADQFYNGFTCITCDVRTATPVSVTTGSTTTINFALSRGGQVSGRVTDAATGNGLANVTVTIYNGAGQGVAVGTTDASGNYLTPEGVLSGTYYALTSNSLGYLNQLYNGIQCVNCVVTSGTPIQVTTGVTTAGINFALSTGGRISGRITDASTGLGITNASVNVYDSAGNFVTSGGTDGAGNYVIAGALVPGSYYVRTFNGLGYIDQIYKGFTCLSCNNTSGTPVPIAAGNTTINFALVLGGRIGGRITDATTGNGISNAFVQVFNSAGTYVMGGTTDNQGNYVTYGGIPAGNYFMRTANTAGYFNQLYSNQAWVGGSVTSGALVPVVVGSITTINFALNPGGAIASGHVSDAATGLPLINIAVDLYTSSGAFVGGGSTDASGNYVIDAGLSTGSYRSRTFNSAGYVDQLYSGISCPCAITSGTPIQVTAGTNLSANFALTVGGQIAGSVTDRVTGNTLPGVTVEVFNSQGVAGNSAVTDASGSYVIRGLPTGTYFERTVNLLGFVDELYFGLNCVGCSVTTGTPINVTAGSTTPAINFTLTQGGSISGRVTDALSGTGIASVTVSTTAINGSFALAAATDANGNYTISGLLPGTYFARTNANPNLGKVNILYNGIICIACAVQGGSPIQVQAGQTTSGVNFALPASAKISGHVTDAVAGSAVGNVVVQIFDASGGSVGAALTDGTGAYATSTQFPPGTYYAFANGTQGFVSQIYSNTDCATCSVTTGTPITAVGGLATTGIDFSLRRGGQIAGNVTDASTGGPLSNVSVQILDVSGAVVGVATTNSSGQYLSDSGLQAGTYFAETSNSAGYINQLYANVACLACTTAHGTAIPVTAGSTTQGINFGLTSGGRITGHVTSSATGQPISGVTVQIADVRGITVTTAATDTTGSYLSQDGLPPGTYYAFTTNGQLFVNGLYRDLPCLSCSPVTGTPVSVLSGTTGGIDFALVPAGRFSGLVTDSSNGLGLRVARVNVFDSNGVQVGAASSNISGTFTSPPLPAGSYFAVTSEGRYITQLYQGTICLACTITAGTSIPVTVGAFTPSVNFALQLGGGVSGNITNASTGAPLPNIRVRLFNQTGQLVTTGVSNASGGYTSLAGLTTGSYFVNSFNNQAFGDQQYQNQNCFFASCVVTGGNPISVTAGTVTPGINVALPFLGGVTGSISDADTGLPLPGVTMLIFDSQGNQVTSAFTDNSGAFATTGLPSGTYYARTENSLGYVNELYSQQSCIGCNVTSGTPILVTTGGITSGINVALTKGGLVTGQVISASDGTPIANVNVQIYASTGSLLTTVPTDGDGNFISDTGLPNGLYYAATSNSLGYIDQLYNAIPCTGGCTVTTGTTIAVTAGSTTRGILFSLSK